MKIKLLKNRRDRMAGDIVDLPADAAAKFIRQGFAEAVAKKAKAKPAKKKAKKKTGK